MTLASSIVSAQRADTTAAWEAVDAFGLSVAGETIGLYSDKYVRGFSPVDLTTPCAVPAPRRCSGHVEGERAATGRETIEE